jgi:hypothetical protein
MPPMWTAVMAELRELHLGKPRRRTKDSVGMKLQKVYEEIARKRRLSCRPSRALTLLRLKIEQRCDGNWRCAFVITSH